MSPDLSGLELSEVAMRAMVEQTMARIVPHLVSLPEQPAQDLQGAEIVAEPQLSILAFRLALPGLDLEALNALNRRFLERVNAPRRIYLTPTLLKGAFVLRMALLSARTHRDRVAMGLEDIRNAAATILASP